MVPPAGTPHSPISAKEKKESEHHLDEFTINVAIEILKKTRKKIQ